MLVGPTRLWSLAGWLWRPNGILLLVSVCYRSPSLEISLFLPPCFCVSEAASIIDKPPLQLRALLFVFKSRTGAGMLAIEKPRIGTGNGLVLDPLIRQLNGQAYPILFLIV